MLSQSNVPCKPISIYGLNLSHFGWCIPRMMVSKTKFTWEDGIHIHNQPTPASQEFQGSTLNGIHPLRGVLKLNFGSVVPGKTLFFLLILQGSIMAILWKII